MNILKLDEIVYIYNSYCLQNLVCVLDLRQQVPSGVNLTAPVLGQPHGKSGCYPGQRVSPGVWTFSTCLLWISEENLVHFPL